MFKEPKPAAEISADELTEVREGMKLSRSLFARFLRANVRTLEDWKQGRAKPNAQAALLIRLVQRYPTPFSVSRSSNYVRPETMPYALAKM